MMSNPTPEELWARYDELDKTNPVAAARFAQEHRVFEHSRPVAAPTAPVAAPAVSTAPNDARAVYDAWKDRNPVWAARFAHAQGLFDKR